MSFIYEEPLSPPPPSVGIGKSGMSDLYAAARDSAVLVDNYYAEQQALAQAYDDRIAAVKKATGVQLYNPLQAVEVIGTALPQSSNAKQTFAANLADLARRYPDKVRDIRPNVPVEMDAQDMARKAGRRMDFAWAANPGGVSGWAAMLAGGLAGGMRDPLQIASLMLGGGAGTARNTAMRILQTAAKEAIINGAVEAAMQPRVQAWRREIGLDNGFDQAVRNTLMAAGFAGVLGGGGQAAGEIAGRLLHGVPPTSQAARAINGTANDAAEALAPVADALGPEARGALEAAQIDHAITSLRPEGLTPATHDSLTAAALRTAEDEVPMIEINTPAPRRMQTLNRPMNVAEFIAVNGGLRDDAGELASRGLNAKNTMTRFGPFWRRAGEVSGPDMLGGGAARRGPGIAPDAMREKLVEAGYLNDRGWDTNAAATTTASDIYDLIDRHLSGEAVVSRRDTAWQIEIDQAKAAKAHAADLEARYGAEGFKFIRKYSREMYDELASLEVDPLTLHPEDAALAHQIMMDQAVSADLALERAIMINVNKRTRSVAKEAGLRDTPFIEDGNGPDAGHGAALQGSRTGDTIGSGTGRVRGERGSLRVGGEDAPEAASPLFRDPGPAEGGIDDPAAPAVVEQTARELDALKADYDALKASGADMPPDFPDIDELLNDAQRPHDLAQLIDACKAV